MGCKYLTFTPGQIFYVKLSRLSISLDKMWFLHFINISDADMFPTSQYTMTRRSQDTKL